MNTAYIGLGSNLGNSVRILQEAWKVLGKKPGIKPGHLSPPYRTEPVGMDSPHWFINAAGSIATTLKPAELLQTLLSVEKEFGRRRDGAAAEYCDRTLDFDLLLYEDCIINRKDLILPHPEIERRLFVLYPLCDIAPQYVHPLLQKTVQDLLRELEKEPGAPAVEKVSWTDRQ